MKIECFEQGSIGTNCYIVYDEVSRNAFCVDVSDRIYPSFYAFIQTHQLNIQYVLLTHGHYDHASDIKAFCSRYPAAKVVISIEDDANIRKGLSVFCHPSDYVEPTVLVEDGDTLDFCGKEILVIATPGHTSGSVCYLFEDALFCGDTVFYGSIGRTDVPTGSFFEIMKSVSKISRLGNYKLFPGHMQTTDIPTQRKVNPYFRE
ncbi:MAG: MBL fold metallo-hydrolase [Clostridia bacterium]|nr:MBL fold metallo-hydrolase [Clostridia bacterium]